MIKYYDTLAAYNAATKSDFESQVSLIGESNECKYDGRNAILGAKSARTGSIAVLDGSGALHFVSPDTFSPKSFMSNYKPKGIVDMGIDHDAFRGQISIIGLESKALPIFAKWQFRLTGFTIDGTEHTSTLSICQASDNWAALHDYLITYTASNIEGVVAALNAYFTANEPFVTQDWVARADTDGSIAVWFNCSAWRQYYNSGKNGFSFTENTATDWLPSSTMPRMNGVRNGEGCTTNMYRMIANFKNDINSTTYNPASDITSIKCPYPICLPAYLGTSQYRDSDHCAFLRAIYGGGEEGWRNFLKGHDAVLPSSTGIFNTDIYGDGKRNTAYLASLKCPTQAGGEIYQSPAAHWVASKNEEHALMGKGQWFVKDVKGIIPFTRGLKYPSEGGRDVDPVNKALQAVGAPALYNYSDFWSSSRCNRILGWCANGSYGFAGGSGFYYQYVVVPSLLLSVEDAL